VPEELDTQGFQDVSAQWLRVWLGCASSLFSGFSSLDAFFLIVQLNSERDEVFNHVVQTLQEVTVKKCA
jgi:hypothetical protein